MLIPMLILGGIDAQEARCALLGCRHNYFG
jgi:hypothetical protein